MFEIRGGFNGLSSEQVVFKKYFPSALSGLAEEAANSAKVGVLIAQFSDGLVLQRMPGEPLATLFSYEDQYLQPTSLNDCLNFVRMMTSLIRAAVQREFARSGLVHS